MFIHFLKEDEQLYIQSFTKRWVQNGPGIVTTSPLHKVKRRRAIVLGPTDYIHIRDLISGELSTVQGPRLYFLGVNESVIAQETAIALKAGQYIHILDSQTGNIRTVRGEASVYLSPTENVIARENAIVLKVGEYIHILDSQTGNIRTVRGEASVYLSPTENVLRLLTAIPLKTNQYAQIVDTKTGEVRTERGENSVYLSPTEDLLDGVCEGINIDENTAVLIRNLDTGQLELITTPQVFIPEPHQRSMEERKRIRLADHEAVIIRDKSGEYRVRRGTDQERAFFLQPYDQIVELTWSTGIHKDKRDLKIKYFDSRPKFMWYEFEVRTQDNVELIVGITFFWQVINIEAMLKTTDDVPGDICSHTRSIIIQAVSQTSFERFLSEFNTIVWDAVLKSDDIFFVERGVEIHSIEVRSIECKDEKTQQILNEIIQETTNRLNRLQKQNSDNEVKLEQLKGQIEVERAKDELLQMESAHTKLEAVMRGEAEAERLRAYLTGLGENIPVDEKIEMFNLLRKQEILTALSKGSAHLYFTPADVDLSIEAKAK